MLLNLTNHPSANWSAEQMQAAINMYDTVEDMPFPNIDPHWTEKEVKGVADEMAGNVRRMKPLPKAIHIMGELTFTYALVNRLISAGITCVASTTERLVSFEANGEKMTTFRFVGFREY